MSFILQSITGQQGVAYRHIILLALSPKFPKFPKKWPLKSPKIAVFHNPTLIWCPAKRNPLKYPHGPYTSRNYSHWPTFLSLIIWVYLQSNLCSKLQSIFSAPERALAVQGRLTGTSGDLVGVWPVSDEVSPLFSVLEQSWLFDLLQCGSSRFDGFLDVLRPSFPRSASAGSGGLWLPFPPTLCSSAGCHSSHVTVPSHLCVLDELQNAWPVVQLLCPRFAVYLSLWRLWWVAELAFLLPEPCCWLPKSVSKPRIQIGLDV